MKKECLIFSDEVFDAEEKVFYRMLRYELEKMRESFLKEYHRRRDEED